ncbi:hypothetical protein PPTG_22412 [Phytophthora nicotianae INRA-310]|uniref:Uncharacterized protein n=1 Tax=Phytophthora nicotianae (strain INRA-310) TaxID=761204 RepID=W2QJS3_PHYN3|nr:hypothetical protein PPTG_22412 [Phytophthora nicotianae INRA-310]ETN12779.1 hypothetical protein PPTG_22412 [Phytophthora nicotianae INRA-310]
MHQLFLSTCSDPAGTRAANSARPELRRQRQMVLSCHQSRRHCVVAELTRQDSRHALPAMAPPNGTPPFVRSGRELG